MYRREALAPLAIRANFLADRAKFNLRIADDGVFNGGCATGLAAPGQVMLDRSDRCLCRT